MALAMRAPVLAPLVLLIACGPSPSDPGPGGVTVSEAQALDEAAEMLEQRHLSADAATPETPTPSGDNR